MEQKQKITTWLGTGAINIFGLPFAGKDTQGKKLVELTGGILVSSGDVLRHSADHPRLQAIMASGDIIPSDLFEEVMLPYLARSDFAGKPLILSEVGRTVEEAQAVMRATTQAGHPIKAVVLLSLADSEVWKRFDASQTTHDRGDRPDDNRSVIQNRLDEYHEKVAPVLDWYRQQGLLIEIDGSPSREEVTEAILSSLEALATRSGA